MSKKTETKSIWKECWEKYVTFVVDAWKNAWTTLKEALIQFVLAIFEWLRLMVGATFGGLWTLIILPICKWLKEKISVWISKIQEKVINWIKRI